MLSEDYAASFQEYFDAYYEEILKYCYIHLGYNQTHAQECCQEVFLLCLHLLSAKAASLPHAGRFEGLAVPHR